MRERLKCALDSPSLVTELFKKKNRKCLLALVILTSIFLAIFPFTVVKADALNDQLVGILEPLNAYTTKDNPVRPDGKKPFVTKADSRVCIAGMAEIAIAPNMLYYFFDTMSLATLNLDSIYQSDKNAVSVESAFTGGYATAARTLIETITKKFIPAMSSIALGIVAIHFLVGMIELGTSDRMTIEVWIKYWAKLIIAIAAIFYAPQLFDLIWQFSQGITSFVSKTFGNVTNSKFISESLFNTYVNAFDQFMDGFGFIILIIFGIFSFIQGIIMMLLSAIVALVTLILTMTRVFEFVIRGAFLPIGIAALADDGWHGAGGRYFKKLFALAIQGGVIMLIIKAVSFLRNSILANMATGIGNMITGFGADGVGPAIAASIIAPLITSFVILGVSAAGIAAMFKSIQISSDIVGA